MGSEESKPQPFTLYSKMVHNQTKILTGEKNQQSYPETITEYCQSLVGLRFHGQTSDRQVDDYLYSASVVFSQRERCQGRYFTLYFIYILGNRHI